MNDAAPLTCLAAALLPSRAGWPRELVWLHNVGDILLWLACLAIALVLGFLASQRRDMPFRNLLWLFVAFILLFGFTLFFDAVTSQVPVFGLFGLTKLLAGLAAWLTVVALVPAVPRALNLHWQAPDADRTTVRLSRPQERTVIGRYGMATAMAGLTILARIALDPLLGDHHPFLFAMLGVVAVAWRGGLGPALLCLVLNAAAATYLFLPPRNALLIADLHHQFGLGLFCFVGVGCALLGELQRDAALRAEAGLMALTRQQRLLEEEIERRRRVETQLRLSEVRFRTLAEAMPQLVWSAHADGSFNYVNQRWTDYTGLTAEASLGLGWQTAVHEEDRDTLRRRWEEAAGSGRLYQTECRLRRHDGTCRWFLARARPQGGDGDAAALWFGTFTDIDDQKATEHQLRLSEERFRVLSEEIPQMVWRADPAGDVVYYNRRWHEYTGLSLEETAGQGWQHVIHPEDRADGVRAWERAVAHGDRHEAEQRLRRGKDGAYRWHLVRARPLRNDQGAIEQWVGTITDIDDQRRQAEALEQEVRRRTADLLAANDALQREVEERRRAERTAHGFAAELQRSNRELEQFAAVASHDLQEPLRKIQAFGDRLQNRCGPHLNEQGRDYVSRILNSAERMRRLIDDLLAYARITTRGQPFSPVDLQAVARDVVSDLEGRLQHGGGRVELGELPTVAADPLQMRQLLQNLIGNGLKFQQPGTPPLVRVSARVVPGPPAACELSVTDNGIGFEPEYAERIFQLFQRLHGRNEYEGTGMGLAICRKIAERHGGRIVAHGTPGAGATFLVTLPVRPADSLEVQRTMPKTGKPITILMAEDDPEDRQMTREAFEESHLANDLRFVEDGVELLDYLHRRGKYADPALSPRPGLILLDLNMPRKDGREALQEIKDDPRLRNIRIVVLTTSKAEEDILRSYDLSAASYITKPVTFAALIDVIRTLGKYWLEIVELPGEGNGGADGGDTSRARPAH